MNAPNLLRNNRILVIDDKPPIHPDRQEVTCRLNDLDQLVTRRTLELQSANEQLKKEMADRLQAQEWLRRSEDRFSKVFRASPVPLAIQSLLDEVFLDANEGFLGLTGYNREELIGRTARRLQIWDDPEGETAMMQKLRQEMALRNSPCRFRAKSGLSLDVLLSVEVIELDGKPFLLVSAQNMTGQIKLDNQLRQPQKMGAAGRLAAGAAHDINNIVAAAGARPPRQTPAPANPSVPGSPGETILVVDDEPDLRELVVQVLESAGYRVLSAGSGAQALELWAHRRGDIDLLLTDIAMPDGLTGRKLAERLRSEDPRLRVIYSSGYTAGLPGTELANMEAENFLPKPYRPAALLRIVRECFDHLASSTHAAKPAA
jgi:PAS domain S-box-containing protein